MENAHYTLSMYSYAQLEHFNSQVTGKAPEMFDLVTKQEDCS